MIDFIARCGCAMKAQGVAVVSGTEQGPMRHGIWIGDAALRLLEAEGGRVEAFDRPMYARLVEGDGRGGTSLAGLGALRLGLYAARGIREAGLPAEWRAAACSAEGWVLVAEAFESRRLAVLPRPDSVLSLARDSGRRILLSALRWLESA